MKSFAAAQMDEYKDICVEHSTHRADALREEIARDNRVYVGRMKVVQGMGSRQKPSVKWLEKDA